MSGLERPPHPAGRLRRAEEGTSGPSGEPNVTRLLTDGELRLLGLMPNASNYTFLAEVRLEGSAALAVYKPRDGEAPLHDFPPGTLWLREVAAYEVARALGWPSVPPTVARNGPHGPGSVQLYVEADADEHFFTLRERGLDPFAPIAAFDAAINNADRKAGHCLLAPDGVVWVVDHGVCFSTDPKLRTVIWDFAGDPVPRALLDDLRRVAADLRGGDVGTTLRGLLSPAEVEATANRMDHLVRTGRFPLPGMGRPYPWPPV
jgi:uncharacterized repeat protein (TIGR03843 family)